VDTQNAWRWGFSMPHSSFTLPVLTAVFLGKLNTK
jgi:hypothetical protein